MNAHSQSVYSLTQYNKGVKEEENHLDDDAHNIIKHVDSREPPVSLLFSVVCLSVY